LGDLKSLHNLEISDAEINKLPESLLQLDELSNIRVDNKIDNYGTYEERKIGLKNQIEGIEKRIKQLKSIDLKEEYQNSLAMQSLEINIKILNLEIANLREEKYYQKYPKVLKKLKDKGVHIIFKNCFSVFPHV